MIELKPKIYNVFKCPECGSDNIAVQDVVFQGIHVLAECVCGLCKLEFYHDFPVGHALTYPSAVTKKDGKLYNNHQNVDWLTNPLLKSLEAPSHEMPNIHRKIFFKTESIIILNCLDYLYGHVLLKLLNSDHHLKQHKDYGLILVIPKSFTWLVPDGVAEVWTVDIKLKDTLRYFLILNDFFKERLKDYRNVFLSSAVSHPLPAKTDIQKFTKTPIFNLDKFYDKSPTVTFILREDRLWLRGIFWENMDRIWKKLGIKIFKAFFLRRQSVLFSRIARKIKREIPDIKIYAVGLGKNVKVSRLMEDRRVNFVSEETERVWCKIYAESHLVVGVHGSNMLLPTMLAAGFLEILPNDRLGNILQDIFSPHEGRKGMFLGRFVPYETKTKTIGKNITSILKDFKYFQFFENTDYLFSSSYSNASDTNLQS